MSVSGAVLILAVLNITIAKLDDAGHLEEIHVATLPSTMQAFALNPENGDLATIDATSSQIFLFKSEQLRTQDKPEPSYEGKLSNNSVAVAFKKYKSDIFFAVVSSRDSHLLLFDANNLKLVRKIPVGQAGVKALASSLNSEDPFFYYNYGQGHGAVAGAVDLRTMSDLGMVINDSERLAVAADGNTAYRIGPFSPSGFESLSMTSNFTADRPEFVRLYYDHSSLGFYVPDPFSMYTAVGAGIYTRSLEKQVATLPFYPMCFSAKRPVVFGKGQADRFGRGMPSGGTVTAASYNTFQLIGTPVHLVADNAQTQINGAKSRPSTSGRTLVGAIGATMFADDANLLLIHAAGHTVQFVPYDAFQLPEEPFLKLQEVSKNLLVDKEHKIELKPVAENVQWEIETLPDGCKKTSSGVKWTPTNDQIGQANLRIVLSHKEIRRVMDLEFDVVRPHVALPFDITGFQVGWTGNIGIVWNSGTRTDQYGRPIGETNQKFSLIDFSLKKPVETIALPFQIRDAVLTQQHVIFLTMDDESAFTVYGLGSLKQEKTIRAGDRIASMQMHESGTELVLQTSRGAERYNLSNFAPLNLEAVDRFYDGKLVGPLFVDKKTGKKKLIFDNGGIPTIRNLSKSELSIFRRTEGDFAADSHPPPAGPVPNRTLKMQPQMSGGNTTGQPVIVPGTVVSVGLEYSNIAVRVPNATHTNRNERVVSLEVLDANGTRLERVFLYRCHKPAPIRGRNPHYSGPKMNVAEQTVFVALDNWVIRWDASKYRKAADSNAVNPGSAPKLFFFEPNQSAFVLMPDRSTRLEHVPQNAHGNIAYFQINSIDGMLLDENSGAIDVDGGKAYEFATNQILNGLERYVGRGGAEESLHDLAISLIEPATTLLGRKPKGLPFAIPVHVKAIDEAGNKAELRYFVLLELPIKQMKSKIREMLSNSGNAAQSSGSGNSLDQNGVESGTDTAQLVRQIQVLESRIDLLTTTVSELVRQVNELKPKQSPDSEKKE